MKETAKTLARGLHRLLALPFLAVDGVLRAFGDSDRALHTLSQSLSRVAGTHGEYLRREFYRVALEECSKDCCISFGTILSKRGARIGARVYVGTGCTLGLVTLEDDALIASNVDILSGSEQHRFEDPETPVREQGGVFSRVTIGADSWVGNRAVVMADVGAGCVVGAGSVVTKSLPAGSIAVGSPARVVGSRGGSEE